MLLIQVEILLELAHKTTDDALFEPVHDVKQMTQYLNSCTRSKRWRNIKTRARRQTDDAIFKLLHDVK